ncbi:hypothetical protein RUM44_009539 [Polyplax serrata]|uniref:Anaphase-promoting complex subunit 2 n=1 Tax=Polyplax serrata TaxID=468196 RepID=A0ABR1AUN6_POLSC
MEVVEDENSNRDVWSVIFDVFPILNDNSEIFSNDKPSEESLNLIRRCGLTDKVQELVIYQLEKCMRSVSDLFWSMFPEKDNHDLPTIEGFTQFKEAVDTLYSNLSNFRPVLNTLQELIGTEASDRTIYKEKTVFNAFKVIVRSSLHLGMLYRSLKIVKDFYKVSFKVFLYTDIDDSNEVVVQCCGCDNTLENCICQEIRRVFSDVNHKLMEYDLLERIAGDVLTSLIHERIENHVQETCKGNFFVSYIDPLEMWLKTVVVGWLTHIYGGNSSVIPEESQRTIAKFEQKLFHLLYETYTQTRIEELFLIIIEYPESQPAIEDLRICLQKTDLRNDLTQKFQRTLETRLLHPGVNTPDVLTAYISAIKALRHLDPTGVLLETVTHPVRHYLRQREDAIRCVINSLIDDGPSELADELVRGETSPAYDGSPSEEDFENWETWNPDPIDADTSKPSKSRRTSDVISMLVNVYGSKDLFVKEYTTLLAERLLSSWNYDTEKEYRYLELLKLRFGESHMHTCEVMLKDIYDSKRINAHLHCEADLNLIEQAYPTNAKILSAPFWPPFKEETLELPPCVKEQMNIYTKSFENLKGNRTLCWKPHLGIVNMDIELKDRTINVSVTPTRATILWHFQTKDEWTVEELSSLIQVPPTKLRREMAFWQSQGILKEISPDRFLLMEETTEKSKSINQSDIACEEDEIESVMASAQDQREEELQVFWSYIIGMLTNLESMPLERIHQMLKMFASQGTSAVDCSQKELGTFLDRKVREHKLLFSGGLYRLPKN